MDARKAKLYYSIGEVAERFQLTPSLLRFWEKEFSILSPRKNERGTRTYTERDMETIAVLRHLLKERGMTIEGAKKKLRDNKELTEDKYKLQQRLMSIRKELVNIRKELTEEFDGDDQ